jgi:Fe2+ transport system protein FeoA
LNRQVSLDKAEVNSSWQVTSVGGERMLRARMLQMGIVPGAKLEVIRRAPFSDPVEIQIRGYRIALRQEECRHIVVAAAPS